MKKTVLIILAILTFSCSSSDDSSSNSKSSLNPPSWIQGKWIGYSGSGSDQTSTGVGFKFTSDDWCTIAGSLSTCWKYALDSSSGQATAEEEISNTDYIVSIKVGNITNTYHFRKKSNTEIEVVTGYGLNPVYNKE